MKSMIVRAVYLALVALLATGSVAMAQESQPTANPAVAAPESLPASQPVEHRSEANLVLPDLGSVEFLGVKGNTLLLFGLVVCVLGLLFGFVMYADLKKLPVHSSMREISELIYETCKTYLITQGKFILFLELFIGSIMVVYFGFLRHFDAARVVIILIASLVGIAGELRRRLVRHPDQHLRKLPLGLRVAPRQAVPDLLDSAQSGDVDRHAADLDRALDHACDSAFRAG